MRLTKAQTQLLHMAASKPKAGLSFAVVHIHRGSGLTTALQEIKRRGGVNCEAKPLIIYGGSGWEAVVDLSLQTGTSGLGYAHRIERALEQIGRPCSLILHHAETMDREEQQKFFAALEHVCDTREFSVRCVLLAHRVYSWNYKECKRQQADAVFIGWIYGKCTDAFRFTQEGLAEIQGAQDAPLLEKAAG